MYRNTKGHAWLARVAAVTPILLTPGVALADTPSGTDLLLPKPAEFIPALLAFLIIWAVLAKFAWPSILGMMEKRSHILTKRRLHIMLHHRTAI